jgi:hypothetical protein
MDTPEARMQAGKGFPGTAPDGMWEKEVRKTEWMSVQSEEERRSDSIVSAISNGSQFSFHETGGSMYAGISSSSFDRDSTVFVFFHRHNTPGSHHGFPVVSQIGIDRGGAGQ